MASAAGPAPFLSYDGPHGALIPLFGTDMTLPGLIAALLVHILTVFLYW